jgi:electron transport complex protein RnfG
MKRDIIRFVWVLGLISAVTAFGVAGVYQMTRGQIDQKARLAFESALKSVFPDAASFEPVSPANPPEISWSGKGVGKAVGQGGVMGYLARGQKQGYASRISVLVACDTAYTIKSIRILSSAETPGLGERAKEIRTDRTIWRAMGESLGLVQKKPDNGPIDPWFQAQFAGKILDKLVIVKQPTTENIQAITAATVTSRAVTEAVRAALDDIKKATVDNKPETH